MTVVGSLTVRMPDAQPTYAELQDRWSEVVKARSKLRRLEKREEEAAEVHKEAKKATEAAQSELNNLIDELNGQNGGNLFRAAEAQKRDAGDKGLASRTASEQQQMDAEDGKPKDDDANPDAWRSVLLEGIQGIPTRALKCCEAEGVATLGDLLNKINGQPTGVRSINGIGATTAAEFENALTKFWAKNPQFCRPVA